MDWLGDVLRVLFGHFFSIVEGWPPIVSLAIISLVAGLAMLWVFGRISFLQHLVGLNLSRKTIRKHANNLWILGGEIIRDLNETSSLRKLPMEDLVFDALQEGGPLLYHADSEEEQRSFESTCRKFRRFLEQQPR